MKLTNIHIIILLACLFSLFSCTDDNDVQEQEQVECCVKMAWSNGRGVDTRAALTSLLNDGNKDDLAIAPEDYPAEIDVSCDGKNFKLTKPTSLANCATHIGFYQGYISDYQIKDNEIVKGVTARTTLADGEILECGKEDVHLDGSHLQFTFHHTKALVRFLFKVDAKYDKIRCIKVKDVTFKKKNGDPMTVLMKEGGLVLNTTALQCAGYCYIDPKDITAGDDIQLTCAYDIYDKDSSDDSSHITRENVKATNSLQFKMLKGGTPVTAIKAGYYYDLNITINPDYLYVLSEHDNKHITID